MQTKYHIWKEKAKLYKLNELIKEFETNDKKTISQMLMKQSTKQYNKC